MKAAVVRAIGLFASVLVAGAAGAQSTQAVEWKVSEGGNGHWYQFVPDLLPWADAQADAEAKGGHLATVTSASENEFLRSLLIPGPHAVGYLGGFRASDGWRWVTGEAWAFSNWNPGEPNGGEGEVVWLQNVLGYNSGWNDHPTFIDINGSLREWSADCNNDGIVDYGQIKSGQLADDNTNGIPDICEASVTGVVPPSVPSQGGSTITIKGNNFPETLTVLVGGAPATNVARVSPTRITATSPVLLPGMTSVTVNGFTLAEALYIRPECGSDLDQNGIVDAGDISIILLDFGQCYETPLVAPADLVPPLLEAQSASELPARR
jgi:hypothetical protein